MVEALVAALLVDGLEASGGDEPRGGVLRNPFRGPLLHGGAKCIGQGFLRAVEVAQQADQRREDPPGFLAVEAVDLGAYARDGGGGH
jgi:hypothetical protein